MSATPALLVAEPPATYLIRPPLVVDCSALAAILFDEASRDDALRHLSGKTLFAPSLLSHEIASVALKKRRVGWDASSIALALKDFADYPIELRPTDIVTQFDLATRYNISAYDAAYLALAAEIKAPLATFDKLLDAVAREYLQSLP